MKLAQTKIRWLARLMLGLVLFAQGIVAVNACVTPEAGPAQAFAVLEDNEAGPCHDEEISNNNACLAHCTQADQVSSDQHLLQLAIPASIIGWASTQPQIKDAGQVILSRLVVLDTGPPFPIRFCSLLN